jgi:hypothetical protein
VQYATHLHQLNPVNKLRIWQLGELFESFVPRFLSSVHVSGPSWFSSMLDRFGIVGGIKTKYNQYIAALCSLGKRDKDYQESAPRKLIEFPAGSSRIAIVDLVLHGEISGQHSLYQMLYLPVNNE